MARKHPKLVRKDIRKRRHEYTVDDPGQEQQVHLAIEWLEKQKEAKKPENLKEASRKFNLKYHILRSRYSRTHKPLKEARADQQTLSPSQENVVEEWICYLGAMGLPLGISELRHIVEVVSGRLPSGRWVYRFRNRHPNLLFRRAASLDPKRGSAFNKPIIKDCFEKISNLFADPNKYAKFFQVPGESDINPPDPGSTPTPPPMEILCNPVSLSTKWMIENNPASCDLLTGIMPKNIASYDEKPCIIGGGRGLSGEKFIFGKVDRSKCKVKDGNQELITVSSCSPEFINVALIKGVTFINGSA